MDLFLHSPDCKKNDTHRYYHTAFKKAVELYVVTAYLTNWDDSLQLHKKCKQFRIIIGKDFGITRKAACEAVMKWLPKERKAQFMVADGITGFHPKAVFWREATGDYYALVGSSNLTQAAFESNYEANSVLQLTKEQFSDAKQWVKQIEEQSVVVSEDWLDKYNEASLSGGSFQSKNKIKIKLSSTTTPLIDFNLPKPKGMKNQLDDRRRQLANYEKHKAGLIRLFRNCANGKISSEEFYDQLPEHWDFELDNRFQYRGWERKGKGSDFKTLSKSFINILSASDKDRDDIVAEEIDHLCEQQVPTRGSFLSEMLCLRFPGAYPVLNKPVKKYLEEIRLNSPRGASEGAKYIDLAQKLRFALRQNTDYPAKDLAELDTIFWLEYDNKSAEKE